MLPIDSFQIFQQETLVCSLLCTRNYYNLTVNTLCLINCHDASNFKLFQVFLKQVLLVQVWSDYCEAGCLDATVFKIVNYNSTQCSFYVICILKLLSVFKG